MTSSLGLTAFMTTSYLDIKANKLNNTLRRLLLQSRAGLKEGSRIKDVNCRESRGHLFSTDHRKLAPRMRCGYADQLVMQ